MQRPASTTPPRRGAQPRPRTSSERGRKFRAAQRERETALARYVTELRGEVQSLTHSRQLLYERRLHTRYTPDGSCARAIREFFSLFRDGLEGSEMSPTQPFLAAKVLFKENYMRYIFDPDAVVGDLFGVDAAIDQWRRYTVLHDRFHLEMGHIDTLGAVEDPLFNLHVTLTVRISRATFQHIFPSCVDDEQLVTKFLNRLVVYDSIVQFRFNDEGRITFYNVIVDFVGGLLKAGGSIGEVTRMLQRAMVTPSCMIRDDDDTAGPGAEYVTSDDAMPHQVTPPPWVTTA